MTHVVERIEPASRLVSAPPAQTYPGPRQSEIASQNRISAFVDIYCRTYEAIRYEADLSPRNKAAQAHIVTILRAVRQPYSDEEIRAITFHPDVRAHAMIMRRLFAKAERETEHAWAARLDSPDLTNFRLFRNYDRQIENELIALGYPQKMPALKDKHRILIVGAGALPVDAVLLHQKTRKRVTCIDSDKKAVELGRGLIQRLGYSHAIEYIHASADMYGYENHPLVIMQNEVSNNFGVMDNIIAVRWVEQMAIRSARGLYALLYTPFPPDVASHFKIKFHNYAWEAPETLQTTLFANIIKAPERINKPGKGYTANDIYPFTLAEQQKAQLQGHSLLQAPS